MILSLGLSTVQYITLQLILAETIFALFQLSYWRWPITMNEDGSLSDET